MKPYTGSQSVERKLFAHDFGIMRSAPGPLLKKIVGISAMVGGLKGSYPKHYNKTFQSTKYFPVDATPLPGELPAFGKKFRVWFPPGGSMPRHIKLRNHSDSTEPCMTRWQRCRCILRCIKPCKPWDRLPIDLRISEKITFSFYCSGMKSCLPLIWCWSKWSWR